MSLHKFFHTLLMTSQALLELRKRQWETDGMGTAERVLVMIGVAVIVVVLIGAFVLWIERAAKRRRP